MMRWLCVVVAAVVTAAGATDAAVATSGSGGVGGSGVDVGEGGNNNDVYLSDDPPSPPSSSSSSSQDPDAPLIPQLPTQRPHHHRHSPRHHQVHNLVLNPEQNSLCELKPIRQILTHAHCTSREIGNHVCVGTCFSYTVPQTEPETPGDELLDYCASCQASENHWTPIELECEEDGNTYQVTKRVQMITNCSCAPCHPSRNTPAAANNEVTYPTNDHHISELLLYKMLPESHKFKEAAGLERANNFNRHELSLDELKKKIYLAPDQEQELRGKIVFDISSTFQNEEEEPRVVNLVE